MRYQRETSYFGQTCAVLLATKNSVLYFKEMLMLYNRITDNGRMKGDISRYLLSKNIV